MFNTAQNSPYKKDTLEIYADKFGDGMNASLDAARTFDHPGNKSQKSMSGYISNSRDFFIDGQMTFPNTFVQV